MTVLITLTLAGGDTGPFDLFSDVDGFVVPFETSIQKIDLLAGFISSNVPDFASVIKLVSKGNCANFINISVVETTTTTSSTSTSSTTSTTTTASIKLCISYTFGTVSNNNQKIEYKDCLNNNQTETFVGNGTYQEVTICALEEEYSLQSETFLVSNNGECNTTTTTTTTEPSTTTTTTTTEEITTTSTTTTEEITTTTTTTEYNYNFDVTGDWNSNLSYPVTDAASFADYIRNVSGLDHTIIDITNFSLIEGRLRCDLTTNGQYLDFTSMGITLIYKIGNLPNVTIIFLDNNLIVNFETLDALPPNLEFLGLDNNLIEVFNPLVALPSSLNYLSLQFNSIVTFNPTLPLPNNLQTLQLRDNNIVTFNPTHNLPSNLLFLILWQNNIEVFNPDNPLPSNLQQLNLVENQMVYFNPDNIMPISLTVLSFNDNQMTSAGYLISEEWANAQTSFTNLCSIGFIGNIDSVIFENLRDILETKNCNLDF